MSEKEISGRKRLKEALEQYEMTFLNEFSTTEEEIYYSKKHRRKMDHILKRARFSWLTPFEKIGKCVAILAVVFLLAFSKDVFSYGEHKYTSELYSYTMEELPDVTWYRFSREEEGAPKVLETLFEPTYIPENFELVGQHTSRNFQKTHSYCFENVNGADIWFFQNTLSYGVGLNEAKRTIEILQVDDIEVVYATATDDEGSTILFWGNYGYTFRLQVPNTFSKEECIKILKSIQKVRE